MIPATLHPAIPRLWRALCLPLIAAAVPAAGAGDATALRTTLERVYTAEQATRGRTSYVRACASCHPLDLYTGETMKSWEKARLSMLVEAIQRMPPENPGSLKPKEYVAIVAFLLSINGMPAGDDELPEGEALKHIEWRSKP